MSLLVNGLLPHASPMEFLHWLIFQLSLSLSLSLSHINIHTHTHSLSLSLSLTNTHTHTLSLSFSLQDQEKVASKDSVQRQSSLCDELRAVLRSMRLSDEIKRTEIAKLRTELQVKRFHQLQNFTSLQHKILRQEDLAYFT